MVCDLRTNWRENVCKFHWLYRAIVDLNARCITLEAENDELRRRLGIPEDERIVGGS